MKLERIVGVIEGISRYPFDQIYDFYFTDSRLVVATIVQPIDFAEMYTRRIMEDMIIGGSWRRRAIRAKSQVLAEERRNGLKGKTPTEILSIREGSFEIPYKVMSSIEAKKGILGSKLRVIVTGNNRKRSLSVPLTRSQLEDANQIIKEIDRQT